MKKQTLLGAAALTTLAVAGAAHAGTLSAANVGGASVTKNRVVATEVALTAAGSKGTVGLTLTPSTGAILPSGNALLKVSLTGGATFGKAVTAGAVLKGATCQPTTTVSSGGGENDSTVTFLVSGLNNCSSAAAVELLVPVKLNTTASVNIETNLTTELGTSIDGGTASTFVPATKTTAAKNLISFARAFDVEVTPDTTPTKALLAGGFKALTADVALGEVEIVVTPDAYNGIDAAATQAVAADVTNAKFTVKGDLSTVDVLVNGTPASAAGVVNIATPAGIYSIDAGIKAPTPPATAYAIKSSAYTIETELTLKSTYNPQPAFGPSSIQPIVREGASYLLPWVASGTLSATSTSNTVVRIANTGAATGAVSIELLTSSAGVPASTGLVPVATSIAKGGELVLTSQSLQDKLGADFGRGDIRVTVEGQPSDLIIRRFVQSTVNGALSEVSLGRSATGQEPQN